ncbi:Gfo/Idh/MocA family protein [Leptospira ilyithenensis]|uniref:Gfo/Idh/MocA family oxidoreductase n=1 Tax=Leptospira ilyithenensis TaxID=2484901 RepID=A0A4R9LPF7_9LEPT|nr:Gfo/Idh/MocA family oxidoreductase [Leptospira ilyithenensis]TGN10891.1 gfo/Idh/MocA family oxidoreductase [Leptospira ilyithenensis]
MDKKVRLGVIGTGHMGQYHVNVAKMLSDAELIGIFDASMERATQIAEKHKTKAFASEADLFKEVDAVIIAAPTFLHHKIAKDALAEKIHVLVEKPISQTVEEAKELVDLANANKLILQVGHVERFNGAVLELGKIAEHPLMIESRRIAPFNTRISDVGVVLDMMIHDIDIVLNLVKSDVVDVKAVGSSIVSKHEDVASVVLRFANGCVASLNASRASQAKIRTLNISQKDSYLFLDFTNQEIEIHRQASSTTQLGKGEIRYKQESIVEKIFVHKDNPLKQEHEHFVSCIQGNAEPMVKGESDIRTLEVAYRILQQIGEKK